MPGRYSGLESIILSQTSDSLSRVLASIRVTGAVLSLAHLEAPFAVESGRTASGIFHAVLSGVAWAAVDGAEAVRLEAGQVAVFPSGASHAISSDAAPTVPPVPVSAEGDGPLPTMRVAGGGPPTRILCGTIGFDDSPALSMTAGLPPIVVTGTNATVDWTRSTIELIAEELRDDMPASAIVAARLADVLVMRALRETAASGAGTAWLAGATDSRLAPALAALHTEPDGPWTVASLAERASMSRSTFYERFRSVVGVPPGEYVTRWRMHMACRLLRDSTEPVGAIGRRVGFDTDAGFSTAFKRVVGTTPSRYRRANSARRANG